MLVMTPTKLDGVDPPIHFVPSLHDPLTELAQLICDTPVDGNEKVIPSQNETNKIVLNEQRLVWILNRRMKSP